MASNKYSQEDVDKLLAVAARRFEHGGVHLGVVRKWMQRNFKNGSTVTWGSRDQLGGTHLTPATMESLATAIMFEVLAEIENGIKAAVRMELLFPVSSEQSDPKEKALKEVKSYCQDFTAPRYNGTGLQSMATTVLNIIEGNLEE